MIKATTQGSKTEATNKMTMKLDKRSEEELKLCRPGVGVLFMKVAEKDVRVVEFTPTINNTLRTSAYLEWQDLHEMIEGLYTLSKLNALKEVSN